MKTPKRGQLWLPVLPQDHDEIIQHQGRFAGQVCLFRTSDQAAEWLRDRGPQAPNLHVVAVGIPVQLLPRRDLQPHEQGWIIDLPRFDLDSAEIRHYQYEPQKTRTHATINTVTGMVTAITPVLD